ncbi:MAG: hypothetical protein H0V44_08850, partial [Planctomycetes bacterium]|nr:hypothetical protein [Planctomycetota bacterium]
VATARFDDARRRLGELRTSRSWLDDAEIARDIDLAEARFHAKARRLTEAATIHADLRKRYPLDLTVCRALVDDLAESDRHDLLLSASLQIADAVPGELPAEVLGVITRSFDHDGPNSELAKRLRATLIAHDPGFVARMRTRLASDDVYERMNAHAVLVDATAISPDQELRYHLKNLLELGSNYTVAGQAVDYIRAASSAADWAERKRRANVGPVTKVAALDSDNEHALRVAEVLTSALRDESRQLLLTWANADDAFAVENDSQRAIAYRALRAAGLTDATAVDPWSFHARTLRTFHIGNEPFWFDDAIAYFRERMAARPDDVKGVLAQCATRIEAEIEKYKKARLDGHVLAPQRELQIVRDVIAGKSAAP